jgi:hypothetical protein
MKPHEITEKLSDRCCAPGEEKNGVALKEVSGMPEKQEPIDDQQQRAEADNFRAS